METPQARELSKQEWQSFFDTVSKSLAGKGVDITLSSLAGEVHQSTLWQLHGVTYDPYDDAVIVSCREQEHVISSPARVFVTEHGASISSLEVAQSPNERETIRFLDPVMLTQH